MLAGGVLMVQRYLHHQQLQPHVCNENTVTVFEFPQATFYNILFEHSELKI